MSINSLRDGFAYRVSTRERERRGSLSTGRSLLLFLHAAIYFFNVYIYAYNCNERVCGADWLAFIFLIIVFHH